MKMKMKSWWNDPEGGKLSYSGTSLSRQWGAEEVFGGFKDLPPLKFPIFDKP
jgi:hypothetical protein